MVVAILSIIILGLFIRVLPIWSQRYRGCDAYYFLLTAETLRKQKKLPVKLPDYYLLDIPLQWYPPGFTVFLALIPPEFLNRFHWLLSPLLDSINLGLLLMLTSVYTHSWGAVLIAGLTYVFTLTLILEGLNLNARFLGNLLLTFCLLLQGIFLQSFTLWSFIGGLIVIMLILLTHKMALQFLVICVFFISIVLANVWPLALFAAAVLLTFLLLGDYYRNVIRSHFDIVTFWNKYWEHLGTHQVYDSPLFKNKSVAEKPKSQPLAALSLFSGFKFLTVHQPFWPLMLIVFFWNLPGPYPQISWPLLAGLWFVAGIIVFLLTTFVNKLKLFGEGYKYLKFTAVPGSFVVAVGLYKLENGAAFILFLLWLAITAFVVFSLFRKYRQGWFRRDNSLLNEDSQRLVDYLQNQEEVDYLLCLPPHICDAIVYQARKHVLWGTHHYMFNERVKDFYPLLCQPLEFFREKYGIRYAVVDRNFVEPEIVGLYNPVAEFGNWAVFRVASEKGEGKDSHAI